MADLVIHGLDEQTIQRLQERARRNGTSLHDEAKRVLETVARRSTAELVESGSQWQQRLGRRFDDSTELIREDRAR